MSRGQHKRYHGSRYARKEIAKLISPHNLYVEPFAGHAWVWREYCPKQAVLGDINREALNWIKKNQTKVCKNPVKLVRQDWKLTVKQTDSPRTFFFFDPPYNVRSCSPRSPLPGACGGPSQREVIEFAKKLKGRSMIQMSPKHAGLCPSVKRCIPINVRQGKKNFKYLIGVIK